jgi:hypothetical protein
MPRHTKARLTLQRVKQVEPVYRIIKIDGAIVLPIGNREVRVDDMLSEAEANKLLNSCSVAVVASD